MAYFLDDEKEDNTNTMGSPDSGMYLDQGQQGPVTLKELNDSSLVQDINDFGSGMARGVAAPVTGLQQLITGRKHELPVPSYANPNSTLGKAGNFTGQALGAPILGDLAGLTKVGEGISAGLETLPGVGKGVAGALPKMAGWGALGAASSPDHPIVGGTLGAAALPLAGAVTKGVQNWATNLDAPEYAKVIMDKLTRGSGISSNAANAAKMIKEQGNAMREQSGKNFEGVFNTADAMGVGDNVQLPNFASKAQEILTNPDNQKALGALTKADKAKLDVALTPQKQPIGFNPYQQKYQDVYSTDLRGAHDIQSALGDLGSTFTSSADPDKRAIGSQIMELRGSMRQDMQNHMAKSGLDTPYQQAIDFHRTNVVPYTQDKTMRDITFGKNINPKGLDTLFAAPQVDEQGNVVSERLDQFGNSQRPVPSLMTVANHGGEELKNRILAESLGAPEKTSGGLDPQALLDRYESLKQKNLDFYNTPSTQAMFSQLKNKLDNRLLANPPTFLKGISSPAAKKYLGPAVSKVKNAAIYATTRAQPIVQGALSATIGGLTQ